MSFVLSFEGPVDLVHALEADLVRRSISQAWVRVRADMSDLCVAHRDAEGLSRSRHASESAWPQVELEGLIRHGEPTRLQVRGIRSEEFGYVHIAGELVQGIATHVSVLVTPVDGTSERPAPARSSQNVGPSALRAENSEPPSATRAPASKASTAAGPTAGSAWGNAMLEAATHHGDDASAATQVPRRGDSVDHFAFGRCEIVKCDGVRAHLRLSKDGRVKELALDLLKVSFLGFDAAGARRYRFDRKA